MKGNTMKKSTLCCFIVIFQLCLMTNILQGQMLYDDVGHIPQSNQINWRSAGLISGNLYAIDVYFVTDYGAVPNDSQDDYSAVMSTIKQQKTHLGFLLYISPPVHTMLIAQSIYQERVYLRDSVILFCKVPAQIRLFYNSWWATRIPVSMFMVWKLAVPMP